MGSHLPRPFGLERNREKERERKRELDGWVYRNAMAVTMTA